MTWTYDKFELKPWTHYSNIPYHVIGRLRGRDGRRLYLHSPYGSFWYLGELLAHQGCYDILLVPHDPPACLFVQTDDPMVRGQFGEGQSVDLLRFGLDYAEFAGSHLARAHIFVRLIRIWLISRMTFLPPLSTRLEALEGAWCFPRLRR